MGNQTNLTASDNYSFTLCPLIDKRKIVNEKKIVNNMISALGVIKYKSKEFICIGYTYGKFEIFECDTLKSVVEENDEIHLNEYLRYIGQLPCGDFIIVSENFIRIYVFHAINSEDEDQNILYRISLIQKISKDDLINIETENNEFSKIFNFDRNLYREFDSFEMEKDRKLKKKDKKYKASLPVDDELVITSNLGIFIFERLKDDSIENINNNFYEISSNEDRDSNEDEIIDINEEGNFDIFSFIEKKRREKYIFKYQLTNLYNYDTIQVNFKYIAGSIKNYLSLYSMETQELVTKFAIKISENCDSVMNMITNDILCAAGDDTISLISIKDSDIIVTTKIRENYKITEICILPDYNILVGMQKGETSIVGNYTEYFYQYKCFHRLNIQNRKIEFNIMKVAQKLLTENYSNITMRCLKDDKIVIVVDLELIQILK